MTTRHTSRRAVLTGAASVPLAAAAATSPALAGSDDDTELLRLGVKLEKLEREWIDSVVDELREEAVYEAACECAGVPWRSVTSMPRDEYDEYNRKRAEATRHLSMTDTDDYNDDLNDRMFALIDEIQTHKAATLAGLAVLTRTCVLSNASQWLSCEGGDRDINFIYSVCEFLGIEPITEIALAALDGDGDGRAAS